ncbi:MAG: ABC transporter ATP-binding protein, partial [Lachnospiraceae bacterium]|nr:ABC transporter ATP-binding protein [Lachnospiraceae bacterium]
MEKKTGWIRRVLVYAAPFKGKIAVIALLYMVQTACSLFMPYVMSNIVNRGVAGSDMDYIYVMSAVMVGMTLASLLCALVTNRFISKVTPQYAGALQKGIFKKTNSLSFEEFGKVGAGSLLTRSTEDVMFFTDMTGQIIYALSTFPVMFIGGVVLSLGCDPLLSLILLLAAPIILLIVRIVSRRMHELWKKSDEYCDIQNSVVRERLTGLRVIRAFDKEDYEHERISDATHVMAKYIISANVRAGTINPVSVMLLNLATVVMLYVASHRIQTESLLTAGDVMAVIQYVTLIMNGIIVMSWSFVMLPQIKVRGSRIAEVLAMEGIPDGDDTGERLDGSIELEHVSFGYEGSETPVLEDINMSIKSGEIVGVIGGTGSGKTTVTKLLLHFYKPPSGRITLGGKSYDELSRETTRGNLSVALQKGMIFGATVGENVK